MRRVAVVFCLSLALLLIVSFQNCSPFRGKDPSWSTMLLDEDKFKNETAPPGAPQPDGKWASKEIARLGLVSGTSANPPNVIFIVSDDQNPNHINLDGSGFLQTPNLKSLKESGVFFRNAYLPIGQCAPSRSSIWTAKLPHQHGVTTNGYYLPTNQLTISDIFAAAQYNTAFIGKCHLAPESDFYNFSRGFKSITWADTVGNWTTYDLHTWQNLSGTPSPITVEHYSQPVPNDDSTYLTKVLTDKAISFIQGHQSQYGGTKPFYLWLAHMAPHLPTTPPARAPLYSLSQMSYPLNSSDNLSTKPLIQRISPSHLHFLGTKNFLDGSSNINSILAGNRDAFEVVTELDTNIGRLVQTLTAMGIRNNTVIVFLSDNGLTYGEHQLYQKGPFMYEEIMRTPLIISYPSRVVAPNRLSNALVTSLDLMPTVLELAGIGNPAGIVGRSFVPILDNASSSHRASLFFEYKSQPPIPGRGLGIVGESPMRGIRHGNLKWINYLKTRYPDLTLSDSALYQLNCENEPVPSTKCFDIDGRESELYDLSSDPNEMVNLMARQSAGDNQFLTWLNESTKRAMILPLVRAKSWWQTGTRDPYRREIRSMSFFKRGNHHVVHWLGGDIAGYEIQVKEAGCSSCNTLTSQSPVWWTENRPGPFSAPIFGLAANKSYDVRIIVYDEFTNTGTQMNRLTLNSAADVSTISPPDSSFAFWYGEDAATFSNEATATNGLGLGLAMPAFPETILCRSSGGRYIQFLQWKKDSTSIFYGDPSSSVRINLSSMQVDQVIGGFAALTESDCAKPNVNMSLLAGVYWTASAAGYWNAPAWPDGVLVSTGGTQYLLHHFRKNTSNRVIFGNGTDWLAFDSGNYNVVGASSNLSSYVTSNITDMNTLIYSFNAPTSLISGYIDKIRCDSQDGGYAILVNRIRGNAANVAYGSDGLSVTFNPLGASSAVISNANSLTDQGAFTGSCVVGAPISGVRAANFGQK